MGRKKLKSAEMAGGETPETKANDAGDAVAHSERKPTYADICRKNFQLTEY
jgi:hypothetical protein